MAGAQPRCQVGARASVVVGVIKDHEALHAGALDPQMPLHAWPLRCWAPAGHRRGAADHHPRAHVEPRHHRVADRPGGVVKVDVNTARARLGQTCFKVGRFGVNRSVKAQLGCGPPVMPTVRQPFTRAICPTHEPTEPAAVDTTTVSPGWGRPSCSKP